MRSFFMAIALMLSFCASADARTELVIGTDEWPPYEYTEGEHQSEHVTGFSTQVILAVLDRINVRVKGKINVFPWARGEFMVINGSLDMLYSAVTNPQRARIVHYPEESLMETAWSFFIRKEDQKRLRYESFDDLKGKRIGVVRGYYYSPEFMDFIKAENNSEDVATDEQNLKKLIYSRVDYIVMDQMNGMYLISRMGLSDKVVLLEKPLKAVGVYPVFSKKTVDKQFVDRFSQALGEYKKTMEYMRIYNSYFAF